MCVCVIVLLEWVNSFYYVNNNEEKNVIHKQPVFYRYQIKQINFTYSVRTTWERNDL